MPQPKNTALRVIVPIGLALAIAGVGWAVFQNSKNQGAKPAGGQPQSAPTGASGGAGATGVPGATVPPPSVPPAAASAPAPQQIFAGDLKAMSFEGDPAAANFAPLGSLDERGALEAQIQFTTLGAGIKSLTLAKHFDTIKKDTHTVLQAEHTYASDPAGPTQVVVPMAADSVEINGKLVSLLGSYDDPALGKTLGAPVWRQLAPGSFEAFVVDGEGRKVVRVQRTYELAAGSFDVLVHQKVENLSGGALTIRWLQYGPVDLVQDAVAYGGDKRRVRFGYLLKPAAQGTDPTVLGSDYVWPRSDKRVLGPADANGVFATVKAIWPNDSSTASGFRPVWMGLTNRYFGVAIHPLLPSSSAPDAKVNELLDTADRVLLHQWIDAGGTKKYDPVVILRTKSEPIAVAAGATADVSMGVYAGPLSRPIIAQEPFAAESGLTSLVVYNWGGPCGFCTFGWVTAVLLGLLRFLHGWVVFDWALGIMVLVLCVRTVLHPITKYQQIRMARFGKGMQALAPKQKKIQEKYADDPQKLREEMAKLWREEGVNPLSGAAGCLPAFLQTPIWIGLTATLYFAFDLRHQGAFFGVFQKISGGKWWFLGDLAEPDRFIYFGKTIVTLPLLGPISSINVLPMILGVVFFIQQKYLTPPSTGTMTPEQEQQQKMMKWMMVFMFPLMMYAAPSGLALYFIMNSTLGILESRYIRSHIDKYDLAKPGKREGQGPGFMARLQQIAEERQRGMMRAKGMQPPRKRV